MIHGGASVYSGTDATRGIFTRVGLETESTCSVGIPERIVHAIDVYDPDNTPFEHFLSSLTHCAPFATLDDWKALVLEPFSTVVLLNVHDFGYVIIVS